jgi:hypothetical protein
MPDFPFYYNSLLRIPITAKTVPKENPNLPRHINNLPYFLEVLTIVNSTLNVCQKGFLVHRAHRNSAIHAYP